MSIVQGGIKLLYTLFDGGVAVGLDEEGASVTIEVDGSIAEVDSSAIVPIVSGGGETNLLGEAP